MDVSALGSSTAGSRQTSAAYSSAKSGAAVTAVSTEQQTSTGSNSTDLGAGAYISPVVRYDQLARLAVLYYRDAATGETEEQIPAKAVVARYRQTAQESFNDGGETERELSGIGAAFLGSDQVSQTTATAGQDTTASSTAGYGATSAGFSSLGGGSTGTTGAALSITV